MIKESENGTNRPHHIGVGSSCHSLHYLQEPCIANYVQGALLRKKPLPPSILVAGTHGIVPEHQLYEAKVYMSPLYEA